MITVLNIDPAPPEETLFTTSVFSPRECWVSCLPIEKTTFVVRDPADIPKYQAMGYKEVITMEESTRRSFENENEGDWGYYDEYPYDFYEDEEDLNP